MIKRILLPILFFTICLAANAQQTFFSQKDNSYNIEYAFRKQKKYYPNITVYNATEVENKITSVKDIVYTSYGERELHLDLFYPTKTRNKKLPVVIFIHGGGWRSGNKTMHWPMAKAIAAEGYVTATVEYRLSTEALYPAPINEIKTAIRFLRAKADTYPIDTAKFAIGGGSAGGQLAALLAIENGDGTFPDEGEYLNHSSKLQACIDIDGVISFIHPLSSEGRGKAHKPSASEMWFGFTPKQNKAIYDEASAYYHANPNSTPILFISSSQIRFNAGREDLIKKLNELNIYSEHHNIADSPHTFWLFSPWAEQTIDIMTNFLKKEL